MTDGRRMWMSEGDRGGRAGTRHADPAAHADALLRAVAQGDEAAFASLYDLVAARVHGLARRVLRDHAHAEEVTQEVPDDEEPVGPVG